MEKYLVILALSLMAMPGCGPTSTKNCEEAEKLMRCGGIVPQNDDFLANCPKMSAGEQSEYLSCMKKDEKKYCDALKKAKTQNDINAANDAMQIVMRCGVQAAGK